MLNRILSINIDNEFKKSREYADYLNYVKLSATYHEGLDSFNEDDYTAKCLKVYEELTKLESVYHSAQEDLELGGNIFVNPGSLSKETAEYFAFAVYVKRMVFNNDAEAFKQVLKQQFKYSLNNLFDAVVFANKDVTESKNRASLEKTAEEAMKVAVNLHEASKAYLSATDKWRFSHSIFSPSLLSEQASNKLLRLKSQRDNKRVLENIIKSEHKLGLGLAKDFVSSQEGESFLVHLKSFKNDVATKLEEALLAVKKFFGNDEIVSTKKVKYKDKGKGKEREVKPSAMRVSHV